MDSSFKSILPTGIYEVSSLIPVRCTGCNKPLKQEQIEELLAAISTASEAKSPDTTQLLDFFDTVFRTKFSRYLPKGVATSIDKFMEYTTTRKNEDIKGLSVGGNKIIAEAVTFVEDVKKAVKAAVDKSIIAKDLGLDIIGYTLPCCRKEISSPTIHSLPPGRPAVASVKNDKHATFSATVKPGSKTDVKAAAPAKSKLPMSLSKKVMDKVNKTNPVKIELRSIFENYPSLSTVVVVGESFDWAEVKKEFLTFYSTHPPSFRQAGKTVGKDSKDSKDSKIGEAIAAAELSLLLKREPMTTIVIAEENADFSKVGVHLPYKITFKFRKTPKGFVVIPPKASREICVGEMLDRSGKKVPVYTHVLIPQYKGI